MNRSDDKNWVEYPWLLDYDECPTEDYTEGVPNGNCEGDGHYLCNNCIHYKVEY